MTDIWILAEHRGGTLDDATYELATAARQLGDDVTVTAVYLSGDGALTSALSDGPFDRVLSVKDDQLATFTPAAQVGALEKLIRDRSPDGLFLAHSSFGYEIGPKLAVRLDVGLVSNVNEVELTDEGLETVRAVYNRKLLVRERLRTSPWLVAVQVGAFPKAEESRGAEVEETTVDLDAGAAKWTVHPVEASETGDVDISTANIVISGGRGLQKPENFDILRELADLLGGVVAGSRPVVDEEWLPRDRQVGTSGKTVKPELYMAVGISGAIQHVVGMKNSETIIAINKDPDAPIFNVATYGVVADLFDVVPKLIEKIKETK